MIRKAKPKDIPAIVDLAVESVSTIDPIAALTIDRNSMRDMAEQCLQPAHCIFVSEIDGKIVGAAGGMVSPSFWHKGLTFSILLHFANTPGEWCKLMKAVSMWMKGRSGIKMAILELEPSRARDCRIVRFANRLGFGRQTMNLQYVRGDAGVESN